MKFVFTLLLAIFISFAANAQLIFNEVCYDPSNVGLEGDANGDGVYDQVQDEFIEFVNIGSIALDISGYQVTDSVLSSGLVTVRHTFAANTIVPAGGALVLFGGGVPVGSFGGAIVVVDIGTAGLSMGNSGEIILLKDSTGRTINSFNSDELSDNPNESYTRNPDITGAFVQHASLPGALKFSPGTLITGQPFVLSTKSSFKANLLKVWPNPAKDKLFLDGSVNSDNEIAIYNQIGVLVFKGTAVDNQVSLAGFQAGMYTLTTTVKGQKVSAQFVVSQ
jgi:hypothetical protein